MRTLCDVSFKIGPTVYDVTSVSSIRSFSSRSAEIVHGFEGLEYHGGPEVKCKVFKETVVLESVS